jgi:hypothetical protein
MSAAKQFQGISIGFKLQIEQVKQLTGISYQRSDRGERNVARNRVVANAQ